MLLIDLCIEISMNHLPVFQGHLDVTEADRALKLTLVSGVMTYPWRDTLIVPPIKAILTVL